MKHKSYLAGLSLILTAPVALAEVVLNPAILTDYTINKNYMGQHRFSYKDIMSRLNFGEDINKLFKFLPSVQYYRTEKEQVVYVNSQKLVENSLDLRPEEFSINGAKGYDNNFYIDGIGSKSRIGIDNSYNGASKAPLANNNSNIVGGYVRGKARHTQTIWLNPDMVGEVKVLTHNIPAKYSDFIGGVVSTKIKTPKSETNYTTYINYNSSKLNSYSNVNGAISPKPNFKKYTVGVSSNQKINNTMNALVSYSITDVDATGSQKISSAADKSILNKPYGSKLARLGIAIDKTTSKTGTYTLNLNNHQYNSAQFSSSLKSPVKATNGNKGNFLSVNNKRSINNGELNTTISYSANIQHRDDANNLYDLESLAGKTPTTVNACSSVRGNTYTMYKAKEYLSGTDERIEDRIYKLSAVIGQDCKAGGYGKAIDEQDDFNVKTEYNTSLYGMNTTFGLSFVRKDTKSKQLADWNYFDNNYGSEGGLLARDQRDKKVDRTGHIAMIDKDGNARFVGYQDRQRAGAKDHQYAYANQFMTKDDANIPQASKVNFDKGRFLGEKVKCDSGATGCINGEQAFIMRQRIAKGETKIRQNEMTAFMETTKKVTENQKVVLGVNLDRDKYTGNALVSPRLSYTINYKDDTQANVLPIIFGFNRYYRKSNLFYALANGRGKNVNQYRVPYKIDADGTTYYNDNWITKKVNNNAFSSSMLSGLKNPYTDEFSVSTFIPVIYDHKASVTFLSRTTVDDFVRDTSSSRLSNGGFTKYSALIVNYTGTFKNTMFSIGTSYNDMTTNTGSLRDTAKTFGDTGIEKDVFLDGKVVSTLEMDRRRKTLSEPNAITFSASSLWDDGNLITVFTGKLIPAYYYINKPEKIRTCNPYAINDDGSCQFWGWTLADKTKVVNGKTYRIYKTAMVKDFLTVDLNVKYKIPEKYVGNNNVIATLTVNNLLKSHAPRRLEYDSDASKAYSVLDRSIFLGLKYSW